MTGVRPLVLGALVLAALLPVGCSTPYGRHVSSDALQTWHAGAARSRVPGLFVHARASVIGLMFGRAYSTSVGNDFGKGWSWSQDGLGVGFMGMTWRSHRTSYAPVTEIDPAQPFLIPADEAYRRQYSFLGVAMAADRNGDPVPATIIALDQIGRLEAGFHCFVGGLSVGFDVVEFLDLLAALMGLDMLGDAPTTAQDVEDFDLAGDEP